MFELAKEAEPRMHKTVLFILLLATWVAAQDRNHIQSSGDYFYGSGQSENAREARDQALAELTAQIAVKVQSAFVSKVRESGEELTKSVEAVLNSYSTAALQNVQIQTQPLPTGGFEVFCFIERVEVMAIFAARKELIADMVTKAEKYLAERNISFALKQLYFAGILLYSLPEENVVFRGRNYTTLIPETINQILLQLSFRYSGDTQPSDKERIIELAVYHAGKPVALLDFSFWDGVNQVAVQAKNGIAAFSLFGAGVAFAALKLDVEYSFYVNRKEYAAVADLWDLVQRPIYKARKVVSLTAVQEQLIVAANTAEIRPCGESFRIDFGTLADIPQKRISEQTCLFLRALRLQAATELGSEMRADSFLVEKLRAYIEHNQPKLGKVQETRLDTSSQGFELRRFLVMHNYPTLPRQTTEYLVLDFDADGTLIDFNLTVTDFLYQRFVREAEFSDDWHNRQSIVKFIEKYRTAYLTRDLRTIDMMFAEEALIIIGRRIKKSPLNKDMVRYQALGKQPDIAYIRLNKQTYLQRQRTVFAAQEDIFVDFGSFDILKKNNAPNVYGVEMRQSYASTTYADEGYLFLMIDFTDPDPLIYGRAWQPDTWSEEELVRTANFKIYK
jgi:hypothetical protein